MIEPIPFADEDQEDDAFGMIRQLIEETVQAEIRSEEGAPDEHVVILIDASSLEEDNSGTLLGVKQARLDKTDAVLFCETEIEGGSDRLHQAAAERAPGEWTVICRVDDEVVVANAGPDGISTSGEGAALA